MNPAERQAAIEWFEEHLDAFVAGDLAIEDQERLQTILRELPSLEASLQAAREVDAALRALPEYDCRDATIETLMERITAQESSWLEGLRARLSFRLPSLGRPAFATAATVLLIAVTLVFWPRPARYTDAELQQAQEQAAWVFAYLGGIHETTSRAARQNVFAEGIAAPLQRSFHTAAQLTEATDKTSVAASLLAKQMSKQQ